MRKFWIMGLWLTALVAIGLVVYRSYNRDPATAASPVKAGQSNAAFVDVPWQHLPHVTTFGLKNQNNQDFKSSSLSGKPYAVSFFFASCPSICRDLNRQVQRLNDQLKATDIHFVSISVDPRNDTPEVLSRYADDYAADSSRWSFLTGQMYQVKQVGEQIFRVVVNKETHTDNILLVDKWGRYRDRFKWDDPYDMKRFVQVARELDAETSPPLDQTIHTRNVMAGVRLNDYSATPWLFEFRLADSEGSEFYTRDMTGQVWIASFFFTSCPGICQQQNQYLLGLQNRLAQHPATLVSITSDPATDTPAVLKRFSTRLGADRKSWKFCCGDEALTHRISTEFFSAHQSSSHHSSHLFVVDKWNNVRGEFDWQDPSAEGKMLQLIDQLNQEQAPPAEFERIKVVSLP